MDARNLTREDLLEAFESGNWTEIVIEDTKEPKQRGCVNIKLNRKQLETLQNALDFEEDSADMHGNYQIRNKVRRLSEIIIKQLKHE